MNTNLATGQNIVSQQVDIMKSIPGQLYQAMPVMFTFSLVQYATSVVINAIPDIGGPVGLIVGAGINGARTVVNLVLWDSYKMSYVTN